jgi:hypothetical protein
VRHGRREQIDRDDAIAQAVERQRIGGGFGKEGVGHGGWRFIGAVGKGLGLKDGWVGIRVVFSIFLFP